MILYPVLDIKGNLVVHGKGGHRDSYRPIESQISSSADPVAVAVALRDRFGCRRLYVADLDAIMEGVISEGVLQRLVAEDFRLLVDAGPRSLDTVERLLELGVEEIVAPLETLPGVALLSDILERVGAARVVFSLDLADGRPLGDPVAWPGEPEEIAWRVWEAGVQRLLVLDLRRVGSGNGPGVRQLLGKLSERLPSVELLSGGGVRGSRDIRALEALGVAGVLVATALHDGSITRFDAESSR